MMKAKGNIRDELTEAIEARDTVRGRRAVRAQMDQITYNLLVAARDRIKELEERLANCDPGSGIDCGALRGDR